MFDLSQIQGLLGNSQNSGLFGKSPMQGMGLKSPFFTERPQQALPTQGFTPTRTNAMGPNAMTMMGMNPNMPNMVGPTSALPSNMQPQPSQLRMYGMEDQLANPTQTQTPGSAQPTTQAVMDMPTVMNPYYVSNPQFMGSNLMYPEMNNRWVSPNALKNSMNFYRYFSGFGNGG